MLGEAVCVGFGLVETVGFTVGLTVGTGFVVGRAVGVGGVFEAASAAIASAGKAIRYTALCMPSLPTSTDFPSRVKAIASSCFCSVTGNSCSSPLTPTDQYAAK